MSAPRDDDPPLAEPGKRQSGKNVGGMRASADAGLGDATQRSMERGDDSPLGRASTGNAGGGAREPRIDMGGKDAPGSAATPTGLGERPASEDRATPRAGTGTVGRRGGAANDGEDGDSWRHDPIAPVDEQNPLKSLGRAVADTLTGGAEDTSKAPKR
jgi:hypothetical protein